MIKSAEERSDNHNFKEANAMTNEKRAEIISAMSSLLERLVEDEPTAPVPATKPDKVEMLTIKECANEIRGLNEYTVRQLVVRNAIPYVRCGHGKRGKILIPKAALLDYFSKGVGSEE